MAKILSRKNIIIRTFRKLLPILPHRHSLDALSLKHGTDKWENRYTKYYQTHFSAIRRDSLSILEIGIGGVKNPEAGGQSLRMWKEYFPNSMIYGIDIVDKTSLEEDRIKIFKGDQNSSKLLLKIINEIGKLDIVIDDGSHINEHVITSFNTLFPKLEDGGIYVIEDLPTSYWPIYGGKFNQLNSPLTTMGMLKRLIDGMHYQYIPRRVQKPFDQDITSIHFYPKIAFITKGRNKQTLTEIDFRMLAKPNEETLK